ncbi:MAG: S41 family peptidase [Candidatus Omnitrophica bacterium]|nr:S41 family peptidase [Candidatus Omnitrophota bacterium]
MKKLLAGPLLLAAVLIGAAMYVQAENDPPEDEKGIFEFVQIFSDAFSLIHSEYFKNVKSKDLIYGAIEGMTSKLDGYSEFLDAESFKEITEETKGEFGGIGVEIGVRDGVLTVISPMEDGPAFVAGIRSGDLIVKINDEITRGMTLDDAIKLMRGDPGTKINISVRREGVPEVIDLEITRDIIKLKSVKEAKILEGVIGYIRIVDFQLHTARDLRDGMKGLIDKGARSVIIDLRNNPGGLLDAAIDAADCFMDPGELIVYVEGRDPSKRVNFNAKRENLYKDIRLIVLVDGGSASASEIFAGAVKDNRKGLIVGETTFGKGSVQAVVPLKDGSAVKLTTAAYYTPSGKNIAEKGIEPDIFVKRIYENEEAVPADSGDKTETAFEGVKGSGKEEKDKDKKEEGAGEKDSGKKSAASPHDRPERDNQLETSVSILKSATIFDGFNKKEAATP